VYTTSHTVRRYKGPCRVDTKQDIQMRWGQYISSILLIVVVAIAKVATADTTTASIVVDYTSTPTGNTTVAPVVDDTRTTADRTNSYDIPVAGLVLSCCIAFGVLTKCFFDWKVQQQCQEIHTDRAVSVEPDGTLSIDRVPWTGEIDAREGVQHSIEDGRREGVVTGESEGTPSLAETMSIKDKDNERNQLGESTSHPVDTKTITVIPL
jgi:hypothetical protein